MNLEEEKGANDSEVSWSRRGDFGVLLLELDLLARSLHLKWDLILNNINF